MATAYDKFRRGERTALLPLMQAMRSGRYPTVMEYAALAVESEGKTDAARAECLKYERSLRASGINPETGRPEADDAYERFMSTLQEFRL